jgi:hypothetical protein
MPSESLFFQKPVCQTKIFFWIAPNISRIRPIAARCVSTPVATATQSQKFSQKTYEDLNRILYIPTRFAEILPRFISKPSSHNAHKRISSDRDPLFYWLYALGSVGAGTSLVFITPRSGVRVSPRYQFLHLSISYRYYSLQTVLALPRFCRESKASNASSGTKLSSAINRISRLRALRARPLEHYSHALAL